ncbi:MAG: hypothetical protein MK052_00620 [Alphaproteobacteria bacterium]|nr:hypothetical protein [Alphaproteobacteria bacterium]
MAFNMKYLAGEAAYRIEKTSKLLQGKILHSGLRATMGGGAATVAAKFSYPVRDVMNMAHPTLAGGGAATQTALSAGEMILSSTGGLLSVGVGAGVNGYLNHIDHKHRKSQLTELYRPQVAAITGKDPEAVGFKDFEAVAKENPSLQNELHRNDRNRTVKNTAAIVATAAVFVGVFAAITLVPPIGGAAALAAAGGIGSGAWLGFAVGVGASSMAGMYAVKKGLTKIGNKIAGLDTPSVEDKVRNLSREHRKEHKIVPEEIMDVFAAASPDLSRQIENKYGKPYEDLKVAKKRAVTAEYAEQLQLPEIATAINENEMNARELTFRVHGQSSGVYPDEPWKEKLKLIAHEKLDPLQEKIGNIREEALDKVQQWRVNREQSKLQDDVADAVEAGKPLPEKAHQYGNESYWRNMVASDREKEATPVPSRP